MHNRVIAAVRFIAPAALAIGTFLSAAPAHASEYAETRGSAQPTAASKALKSKAGQGMKAAHRLQKAQSIRSTGASSHMHRAR